MSDVKENNSASQEKEAKPSFAVGSLPARLVEATENLTNMLHIENGLLLERKVAETKDLQNEKAKLTANYQNEIRALQQNPSSLGPINSPIRQQLKKVMEAFQKEVKNHGRILLRLKTVAEGMVQSISNESSKISGSVAVYDNNAAMHLNSPNKPVNIALNQII
jgi:hypothetical protein